MKEKADVYVAFIGHPPRAKYVGNFFGHIAGKVPIVKRYRPAIEDWATARFEDTNAKWNPVRWLTKQICLRGPIPTDRCVIDYEGGILVEGLYSIPYTTAQILNPDNERIVKKEALKVVELAQRQGAAIIGLGAAMKSGKVFDSGNYFVGNGIPISNGNNYTIASCIDVALTACSTMGIELKEATTAIIGANGSIGSICAEIISQYCNSLILFGNPTSGIEKLIERSEIIRADVKETYNREIDIDVSIDLNGELRKADLIISATDKERPLIFAGMLKRGAVVVDIARPHDTKKGDQQAFVEAGVLVADGGIVYHEGDIHFKSLMLPQNYGLACSFEPAILGIAHARGQLTELNDWVDTNIENVRLVKTLAEQNKFIVETQTFRFHYEAIPESTIETILRNAGR